MRPLAFIAALGALSVLAACRTPERTGFPARPADGVAPRALLHDRTDIRVTAQAGDGVVWGAGWRDGAGVFRWRGDAWEKTEDARGWPGGVIGMAAGPASPGLVYSLWSGPPNTSGNVSVLHLRRHEREEQASVLLASFPNPTAAADGSDGKAPRLAVDAAGDAWLSFPAAILVRVRAEGGEPEVIGLDRSFFVPPAGRDILPLAFMPVAPGQGWLWTAQDEYRRSGACELFRPARVTEGHVEACPPIAGLPDEGRVTFVSAPENGRMVWALEERGLWEIDLATMTARPRSSPPEAWRILDWRALEDGSEVAVVFSRRRGPDRLAGDIWLRRGGAWTNVGPSGDTRAASAGAHGWEVRPHAWRLWDGALLGAGFHTGLVGVDFSEAPLRARTLDWTVNFPVVHPRDLHSLPDGRLLIHGGGSTAVAEPDALRRGWTATEPPPAVWAWEEHPVRADDGRLWLLRVRGRGAPVVRHWDGAVWREWPLPAERDWWPEDGLWVDETGRVVVFSDNLDKPAWERAEDVPEGWRRWTSGKELVAARAAEPRPAATLYPVMEGFRKLPVLAASGRALVSRGPLWSLAGGVWTSHDRRALGAAPFRYGFGDDGVPWFYTNGKKRSLETDGTWVDAGTMKVDRSRTSRTGGPWPEWLAARLDERAASSAHRDEEGVWWIMLAGELWKAWGGEVSQVFAVGEPSPFRSGRGLYFYGVRSDSRGNRFFDGSPHVLLPAVPGPGVDVAWMPAPLAVDRRARVTGGADLARHEWRLDDGEWRRGEGNMLWLRELSEGAHVLEVRGYNRRLDAGPVTRVELRLDYDPAKRLARLMHELRAADYATRAEAVRRLGLRGAAAEPAVRAALAAENDEAVRWWLRAALQAMEDGRDKSGKTP